MGMSGAAGAWIQTQVQRRRAVLPIVRAEWGDPAEGGYFAQVTLVNRLNEDLLVTTVECASTFAVKKSASYDPNSGNAVSTYETVASPMCIRWSVPADGESTETFCIDGAATPRVIRLTISSSAKTLRSRRVTVRDSQSE
jgi:hypothetical protein